MEVVKAFLRHGASPDGSTHGLTALHIASHKGFAEIARFLTDFAADTNDRAYCGSTALHIASASGRDQIVEILLANSARVNVQNDIDMTPFHYAVINGHVGIAHKLLSHEAGYHSPGQRRLDFLALCRTWREFSDF